jgi:hypothetical protein
MVDAPFHRFLPLFCPSIPIPATSAGVFPFNPSCGIIWTIASKRNTDYVFSMCYCAETNLRYRAVLIDEVKQPLMHNEGLEWINAKKDNVVLVDILASSPEFERFYKEECKKVVGFIFWIEDPAIPEGIEAYTDIFNNEIHYRKRPVSIRDSHVMAHEMMHLVRYQENAMLLMNYAHPLYELLTMRLGSMLEDPVIESLLQEKYNFDLRIQYRNAIKWCKKSMKNEPIDDLGRLIWGFDLADHVLCWDLVKDKGTCSEWSDYLP